MATPNRYYSATAVRTQLKAAISASSTVISVTAITGFPSSTPFTLVIAPGQVTEEVVTVTSVSGLNLTVARGQDGSNAVSHDIGAVVMHAMSARDLREPQEHIAADAGVHGITGKVVGTTDVQGLTGKTINGSLNTLLNIGKSALPADTVYAAATQTLSGKTLNGDTLLTNGSLTIGGSADTTQRVYYNVFKHSTGVFTRKDYIYDFTDAGIAIVLQKDGVESARLQLTSAGVLQASDGTTLRNAVLESDTGWVNVAATGQWTGTKQIRVRNGYVTVRMGLTRITSNVSTATDEQFMALSTNNRPISFVYGTAWIGGKPFRVEISSADGGVTVNGYTVNVGQTLAFQITYPLG